MSSIIDLSNRSFTQRHRKIYVAFIFSNSNYFFSFYYCIAKVLILLEDAFASIYLFSLINNLLVSEHAKLKSVPASCQNDNGKHDITPSNSNRLLALVWINFNSGTSGFV